MGFEYKAGAKAPPSLEENYRRWLRSMRDRIDSELAGGERAAEWLRTTLPRVEEDGEMPEECKLQMLEDSVLDSMLREAEAETGARRKKYLAATGVMLSSCAVFVVSAFLIPIEDRSSLSEFLRFMCSQAALVALLGGIASALHGELLLRPLIEGRIVGAAARVSC